MTLGESEKGVILVDDEDEEDTTVEPSYIGTLGSSVGL